MAFQLPASNKNKFNVALDLRIVTIALFVVIVAMLLIWKPWSEATVSDRTVEVNGESTITATPDKFVFYPSYEFKNTDKAAALADISKKSAELTTKLKALGVKASDIKTTSSGYDALIYRGPDTSDPTYSLQMTISTDNLDEAQKVQDYLITTEPLGTVSPQASFSEAKRKQLESQARDKAARDARTKVDQMAKNVGFKVGAVKKISETQGFSIMPMDSRANMTALSAEGADAAALQPSLSVQPGENELPYSVSVTYYIK